MPLQEVMSNAIIPYIGSPDTSVSISTLFDEDITLNLASYNTISSDALTSFPSSLAYRALWVYADFLNVTSKTDFQRIYFAYSTVSTTMVLLYDGSTNYVFEAYHPHRLGIFTMIIPLMFRADSPSAYDSGKYLRYGTCGGSSFGDGDGYAKSMIPMTFSSPIKLFCVSKAQAPSTPIKIHVRIDALGDVIDAF